MVIVVAVVVVKASSQLPLFRRNGACGFGTSILTLLVIPTSGGSC